ncbi:MAG: hypothetical protein M1553_00695, partial [Firmicutes bacterium]|nr:hypothetical protein [Bacillota bacterium]
YSKKTGHQFSGDTVPDPGLKPQESHENHLFLKTCPHPNTTGNSTSGTFRRRKTNPVQGISKKSHPFFRAEQYLLI